MKKLMILVLVLGIAGTASALEYVVGQDGDFAYIEKYHSEDGHGGVAGGDYLYDTSSMYLSNQMVADGMGGLEMGQNFGVGLLQWDVSGVALPAAQITSATVSFDIDGFQYNTAASTLRGYRLITDFTSSLSRHGTSQTGTTRMSDWGAALMGVSGTDYVAVEIFSLSLAAGRVAEGLVTFDITSTVQDWVANGGVTGIILKIDDATVAGDTAGAKVHAGGLNPPGGQNNPYLTIVPEPMTIALLGLGGLFLRRRKK